MSNVVIKVENISKQYRLGTVGTGSLAHDLNRTWARVRGKEDPYLKIGEANDRSVKGNSEYVWALQDINFEVKQGEVLGIIGRNGAGKSTLLKILSRTTTPTTGRIKIKGRVASLLEVGTGFHPELTGRENIFLNGAILGMTKREIKSKFDEIVDFAGVERYIDTPVKRYSSGMYVRLAFGVAAHLEPEILIVDEVLAVGDAEFQRKALGKMKSVSDKDGRTVLFVSHNLPAVRQLCTKALLLNKGYVEYENTTQNVIKQYLQNNYENEQIFSLNNYRNYSVEESPVEIQSVMIDGYLESMPIIRLNHNPVFKVAIRVKQKIEKGNITIAIFNSEQVNVGLAFSWDDDFSLVIPEVGDYEIKVRLNHFGLAPGSYSVSIGLNQSDNTRAWDGISFFPLFTITDELGVLHYKHRNWGINHYVNSMWDITKI